MKKRKIKKQSTKKIRRNVDETTDDLDLEIETLTEAEARVLRIKQRLFNIITKKIQTLSAKGFTDGTISTLEALRKRVYNIKSETQLFELLHNINTLKNELQHLERILNSFIQT